jgi:large subunit ribosomal protein L6
MSRIGKKPIEIPSGIEVRIEGSRVRVKGPQGQLEKVISSEVTVTQRDNLIYIERPSDDRMHRSLHGLSRTLVANMIEGVSQGFSKTLEITGVGYRAAKKGENLELQVGYSHPVVVPRQPGVEFEVPIPTRIVVKGADKEMVGEIAARIRKFRKPEPYKGKGIKYEGEYVRRKVGKTGK